MAARDAFRLGVTLFVLMPLVLSCTSGEKPPRPPDLLLVGTDPCYPPFVGYDSVSDAATGFDIELISLISQANRWRFEDTLVSFEELLNTLKRGDIDVVASALPQPSDSQPDLAFSDPYYLVSRVLVLRTTDSMITCLDDLPAGLVGVVSGTNVNDFAKHVRNTTIYKRGEITRALSELAGGTISALVLDYPLARAMLTTRTELRICAAPLGYEYYVFAVRRADSLRLKRVNDALAALLGGYTYEQLHQKWFGYPPLNLAVPDSVSARWPSR